MNPAHLPQATGSFFGANTNYSSVLAGFSHNPAACTWPPSRRQPRHCCYEVD